MPGYYDWKIRNCTLGAEQKAAALHQTMDMVDHELHEEWSKNGGEFSAATNGTLAEVVAKIDAAEDALESARLQLATLFAGHP